jgi:hypothetical protein
MAALRLGVGYDAPNLETFTAPPWESVLEILLEIEEGNQTWDTLLEKYPNDCLVFIKNMYFIESSGSLFSHWVRVTKRVFEKFEDKESRLDYYKKGYEHLKLKIPEQLKKEYGN